MKISFIFLLLFPILSLANGHIPDLRTLNPDEAIIRDDLTRILAKAGLEGKIDFSLTPSLDNTSHISCTDSRVTIEVKGDERWSQTFYMTLQRLGFFFPHPRLQVSPNLNRIKVECGKNYKWKPALKYAGFHFHTLHPSEWVHGFLLGKEDIAFDTIRWLARNQQNIFDLVLLRQNKSVIWKNLKRPFAMAKAFGIHAGVTAGFALHQQNVYKLISIPATFTERLSLKQLTNNLNEVLDNVDLSFINLEMGTTEFTPVNYGRMIRWMNRAGEITKARKVPLVIKVHVSTNQHHAQYGNFNFLPQYAMSEVGILPHTVYLYGLADEKAPMYGNKNFKHILEFMLKEKDKRRTWYYPESSYFIALDIDTGLLLTDYLSGRAADMKILHDNGIEGQINFTTGHEMGYWLIDWTVALLNNLDYQFDPLIATKLLGENQETWQRITEYQREFFKEKHLLGIITFSNFGDEIAGATHQILERNSLKLLNKSPALLAEEIERLIEAISAYPKNLKIKNEELRLMMEMTELRLHHALKTRLALQNKAEMNIHLDEAVKIRGLAQARMNRIKSHHARYPEAKIWERHKNPTSYPWGYAFGVSRLHYWLREEEVIRKKNFSPFFMNITDWWDIVTKKTRRLAE